MSDKDKGSPSRWDNPRAHKAEAAMPEQHMPPRFPRLNTIRNRLLIIFVALVVMPVAANGAYSAIRDANNAEQRVIAQLESVATLKEAEIQTWLDSLQVDLNTALIAEDVNLYLFLLLQESMADLSTRETFLSVIENRFSEMLSLTHRFDELFAMNLQGEVIVSTDAAQQGENYKNEPLFQEGLQGYSVQPPAISPMTDQTSVFVVRPITKATNETIGVLAGRASLAELNGIMGERAGLGNSGETYLVSSNKVLLTPSRFEDTGYVAGETAVHTTGVNETLQNLTGGAGSYDGYRGVPVIGVYKWLPELQLVLVAEQDRSEAMSAARTAMYVNAGVAAAAVLLALFAGLLVTRNIATPLAELATTASKIASGDLNLVAPVRRADEIGELARSFNHMTAQLRELISGLERRVADRTHDLEQRSTYLEASSEIGRATNSILETDRLIQQAVTLIRTGFDLYYVGLFAVDEAGEWAILRAGTGAAGQAMLARGHRIKVGEGMIGWSIAHSQARVALEAGEDAVRLATLELPDTRSEAALPLRSRGHVLGALTVQSDQPDAFDRDTIAILQTMADQVAVALDNARLFAEAQTALEAERRAYGELSQQAWVELLKTRTNWGYRFAHGSITPVEGDWQLDMPQAAQTGQRVQSAGPAREVTLPLQVRNQVVGVLSFHKGDTSEAWTPEELTVLETLIDQLGLALDSARLYESTQRRVAQEQLVSAVTARIRETLDIETVLQTAAQEVRQALGLPEVVIRLGEPPLPARTSGDGHHQNEEVRG